MRPPVAFPTIVGGAQLDEPREDQTRRSIVWERVMCAVDFTRASVYAAREAARLMPATSQLTLCTVVSPEALEKGVPDGGATHP